MNPHRLILASAGTGKTWQLSGRFLELLTAGVEPRRILATTFTRKAAGEILERVLGRLVEAVEDPSQRRILAATVGRDIDGRELRGLLAQLTRHIEGFSVRTLDAFFLQLARLFSLELGLPPEWNIVDEPEDESLRRQAVARALERAELDEIIGILRALQGGAAARSVERGLLDTVQKGRDAYLDATAEAWTFVRAVKGLSAQQVAGARAVVEAMPIPLTKKGDPKKTWVNARRTALSDIDDGAWEDFLSKGIAKKVVEGETSFDRQPIPEPALLAFKQLTDQAASVIVGQVARRNAAMRRWLERFEEAYSVLKREERAYRFDDLPAALNPDNEAPFSLSASDPDDNGIWYRLDGRIDHLLLDEFQDTSPVQWRLLEHLASEILADGTGERSFFCVGDVKQSIYGWREAEPRLLAELDQSYPVLAPAELLQGSWRSSRIVLDCVNGVFESIGDNAAFTDHPERVRAARDWQADFHPHEAKRELPGAALLLEARPAAEEESLAQPTLELACRRAEEIARAAPQATIGILLRRNLHIARLIYILRESHSLRASGEGGNPLTDSAAVLHALSLMHLADHPGDRAAAFHVATSPLAESIGLGAGDFRERRFAVAQDLRQRLATLGFGRFCATLLPPVRAGYGAWDEKRFEQLIDLAYAFDPRASLRSDRFVDHVRGTKVEDPTATQIQVMTIHAAKGLEFDCVILPELNEPFTAGEKGMLTRRTHPAQRMDAVSVPTSSAVCDLDPDGLGALHAHHEERLMREALCVLYVAMTRAKHRLELLVRAESTRQRGSYAKILCHALASGAVADADGVLWSHPESEGIGLPAPKAARGEAPAAEPELLWAQSRAPQLPRRTPSGEEHLGPRGAADLLRSPTSAARTRGILLHSWLEQIEWLDSFSAGDADLIALASRLTADASLIRAALKDLRAMLETPALGALLTRPNTAGEVLVWRERPFCVPLDGELWSGAFDRVVLERQGEAFVRADVIDFKTDRVEGAALEQRVEHYRPQLEAYRRVLAHSTALAADAIRARIFFLEAGVER